MIAQKIWAILDQIAPFSWLGAAIFAHEEWFRIIAAFFSGYGFCRVYGAEQNNPTLRPPQ